MGPWWCMMKQNLQLWFVPNLDSRVFKPQPWKSHFITSCWLCVHDFHHHPFLNQRYLQLAVLLCVCSRFTWWPWRERWREPWVSIWDSEACDDVGTLQNQPKENDAQQLNSCNAHDRHVGRLYTRHPSYFWSYLMFVLIFNVCGKRNVAAHHFVQLSFLSLSFHHVIIWAIVIVPLRVYTQASLLNRDMRTTDISNVVSTFDMVCCAIYGTAKTNYTQ
jgi:hypothetical protein